MMTSYRRCAPWRIALLLTAALAGGPAISAANERLPASFAAPAKPDVFGTVALNVGRTRYDERWQHAMANTDSDALGRLTQSMATSSRREQLFQVQAAVNRAIAFRNDIATRGRPDHWATAGETLSSRSGDCEDFAILKLQALRRLGFDPADLYLSIGRDRMRGDHAVALVRLEGRFWALDNLRSIPVPAESHGNFEPVFTLAEGGSWLHGRRSTRASGGGALIRAR